MATLIEDAPDAPTRERDDHSIMREAIRVLLAEDEIVRAEFEALMAANFIRPPVRLLTGVADGPPGSRFGARRLEAMPGTTDGIGSRTTRARNRERSPPEITGCSSCSHCMKRG